MQTESRLRTRDGFGHVSFPGSFDNRCAKLSGERLAQAEADWLEWKWNITLIQPVLPLNRPAAA